jgi:hypothetical protein
VGEGMNTEATEAVKKKRERLVFKTFIETKTFIEKSGSQIISETVESPEPPEPDIVCFCQKKEGKVAFELVELCAEDIARAISAISKGGLIYIRTEDPSRDVLRAKLKERYQTKSPVELLCYKAGRTVSPDTVILEEIRPIIDMDNGQFERIWLLGDQCHLVWPRADA